MPKTNAPHRINSGTYFGRVEVHDTYLNQPVRTTSSPTFANMQMTGSLDVQGSLTVHGMQTVLSTDIVQVKDNIMLLNSFETGPGVTLNQAGIEIERGTLENYRFVFDELTDSFLVGRVSGLQTVALIEDLPTSNGFAIWNEDNGALDVSDTIDINATFSSTSSNSVAVLGGITVAKDVVVGERIVLGASSISGGTSGELELGSGTVALRSGTVLRFGMSTGSLITGDGSGLSLSGSTVSVPVDIGVSYGDNERVSADTSGTLILDAASKVIVAGGVLGLGDGGNLVYTTTGSLRLESQVSIDITAPKVNLARVDLSDSAYFIGGSAGCVEVVTESDKGLLIHGGLLFPNSSSIVQANGPGLGAGLGLVIPQTVNSTGSTDGSLSVRGGFSVGKDVHVGNKVYSENVTLQNLPGLDARTLVSLSQAESTTGSYSIGRDLRDITYSVPAYSEFGSGYRARHVFSEHQQDIAVFALDNVDIVPPVTFMDLVSAENDVDVLGTLSFNSLQTLGTSGGLSASSSAVNVVGAPFSVVSTTGSVIARTDASGMELQSLKVSSTLNASDVNIASALFSGGVGIAKSLFVGGVSNFLQNVDLRLNRVTNVGNPVSPYDAVNKLTLDEFLQGLDVKDSVRVATTESQSLSEFVPGYVLDSVVLALSDRILVKDSVNVVENGIYTVSSSGAIRSVDFAAGSHGAGTFVFVSDGIVNKNNGYVCNNDSSNDTVGTFPISFTQFSGAGQIVAGLGLSKSANSIDVNVDDVSTEIFGDALRIKNTAVSTGLTGGSGSAITTTTDQSHVVKVGTLIAGVWNADTITVANGGTGRTQFTRGSILFAGTSSTGGLMTMPQFAFSPESTRLTIGAGTNQTTGPVGMYLESTSGAVVTVQSDSAGTDPSGKPEIRLKAGNIQMTSYVDHSGTSGGVSVVDSSTKLRLSTQQTPRVTVDSNGNVGIGTESPQSLLHVAGHAQVDSLAVSGSIDLNTSLKFYQNGQAQAIVTTTSDSSLLVTADKVLFECDIDTAKDSSAALGRLVISNNGTSGSYIASGNAQRDTLSFDPLVFTNIGGSDASLIVNSSGAALPGSKSLTFGASQSSISMTGSVLELVHSTQGNTFAIANGTVVLGSSSSNWTFDTVTGVQDLHNGVMSLSNAVNRFSYTLASSGALQVTSATRSTLEFGTALGALDVMLSDTTRDSFVRWQPVAKKLDISNSVSTVFDHTVYSLGGGNSKTLVNPSSVSQGWFYLGSLDRQSSFQTVIAQGQTRIHFYSTADSANLVSASHNIDSETLGNNTGNSTVRVLIASDTASNNHCFAQVAPGSVNFVSGLLAPVQSDPRDFGLFEGLQTNPSRFTTGWSIVYDTFARRSNSAKEIGDFCSNGTNFKIASRSPLIGTQSFGLIDPDPLDRRVGLEFERLQTENDSGLGDIVTQDSAASTFVLESQSLVSMSQLMLPLSASATDSFYTGNVIRIGNQVRFVTGYVGSLRLMQLQTAFTTKPQTSDSVDIFNERTVSMWYSETAGNMVLSADSMGGLLGIEARSGYFGSEVTIGSLQVGQTNMTKLNVSGDITVGAGVFVTKDITVPVLRLNHDVVLDSTLGSFQITQNSQRRLEIDGTTGFLKLGTTGPSSSLLTLARNQGVGLDGDDGTLTVSGCSTTRGGRIILYGDDSGVSPFGVSPGGVDIITASTAGTVRFKTSAGETLRLNPDGSTIAFGDVSMSKTLTVNGTEANSAVFGGGVNINGDLTVHGTLTVDSVSASHGSPIVTFSDLVNIQSPVVRRSKLLNLGSGERLWSLGLDVQPITTESDTSFEIEIPERQSDFDYVQDILVSVSALSGTGTSGTFSNLYDIVAYAQPGTKRAKVRFYSGSTSAEYKLLLGFQFSQ